MEEGVERRCAGEGGVVTLGGAEEEGPRRSVE